MKSEILELNKKKSYNLVLMDNILPGMEGVDVEQGLANCDGSIESYREVLESFLEDSAENLRGFEPLQNKTAQNLNETELKRFFRAVHAVKGVSAIIGAQSLSKKAADLEKTDKAGGKEIIQKDFPFFYKDFKAIIERVQLFLKEIPTTED